MAKGTQTTESRLARLLVMVPWVSEEDGPTVEEVCKRFEISEKELEKDLNLLFLCGLYPFTPDSLIEAEIVDGRVWIRFGEAFVRPPAFSRQEAVMLVAAAAAIAEVPGETNPHLQTGLAKLVDALGFEDTDVVDVKFTPAPVEVLDEVRKATSEQKAIEVDYYSFGRDAWSRRKIQPFRVFNQDGKWYLQGLDDATIKVFRVDRMREVWKLDEDFETPADLPEPSAYTPRPTDPVVKVYLSPADEWMAEQFPVESSMQLKTSGREVALRVSEPAWLERLLLRLHPDSKLLEGDVNLEGLSKRLLKNYS